MSEEQVLEQTPVTPEAEAEAEEKGKDKKKLTERKLRAKLEKAEKRAQDAETKLQSKQQELEDTVRLLQRNQADFENFRRRNNAVRAESYDNGKRDTLSDMLPTLDDFQRVMDAAQKSDDPFYKGIELVYRKFFDALTKLGLSPLPSEGKFDPNLHNAVLSEAVEGVEPETILEVFQQGYKLGDKILRHSMVKVSE